MPLSLDDFPEFKALKAQVAQQAQEIIHLKKRQLRWVTDEQAREITGLSRRTLLTERQKSDSLIVFKLDHGLRYDYDSLLRHNDARAVGRSRFAQLPASFE